MSTGFLGSDPDELRRLSTQFSKAVKVTAELAAQLRRTNHEAWLFGPLADDFTRRVHDRVEPRLTRLTQAFDSFAFVLRANADIQEAASKGRPSPYPNGIVPHYRPRRPPTLSSSGWQNEHVRLDRGNGRSVGTMPGPSANTREDVLAVIDRLHKAGFLTTAARDEEYARVAAQPPESVVATSRIPHTLSALRTIAGNAGIPIEVERAIFPTPPTEPGLSKEGYERLQRGDWDTPLPHVDEPVTGTWGQRLRPFPENGLNWELTSGPETDPSKPPRDRVADWLTAHSAEIQAAETRHGVDRRAIAAAIAWEALENPTPDWRPSRAGGPGKVHALDLHAIAAPQMEDLGYLPAQSNGLARKLALNDPTTSISYIAAIMQAHAEKADAGNYNLRADPPMLAFLYNSWDLDRTGGNFGPGNVRNAPGIPDFSSSGMARWLDANNQANLQWLESVVGAPNPALSQKPRGY
jgi:hypothetical protein